MTADFDAVDAAAKASDAIDAVAASKVEQIRQEVEAAKLAAEAYAEALAAGGEPWQLPGDVGRYSGRTSSTIVSDLTGLIHVYQQWNEARGSENPILPIRNSTKFRIAERCFESLVVRDYAGSSGEPVLFSDLKKFNASSEDVRRALLEVEKETEGRFVPRKTKVGGKVAYFLRRRRESDGPYVRQGHDIPEEAVS